MTKILLASPELANVAMVGGIAEYLWGLANALIQKGHDVRVILPHYAFLHETHPQHVVECDRLTVALGPGVSTVTKVVRIDVERPHDKENKLPVYLVGGHPHFASATQPQHIYDWPNHEPWVVFCKGVLEWLQRSEWQPDVLHCQDAHSALLPVYIQDIRTHQPSHPLSKIRTVLTIHNLLNQGKGTPELVRYTGLDMGWYHIDGFEFFGATNILKAGLLWADETNTVSQTYAQEICTNSTYGFGLEGVLQGIAQQGKLTGILNGIDTQRWSIPGLSYDGTSEDIERLEQTKEDCQRDYFAQWGWKPSPLPTLIFRSRWDTQKGVLLLASSMKEILSMARCVIVTWGTPGTTPELKAAWQDLQGVAEDMPQQLLLNPPGVGGVDGTQAHYTMADFVLMPSTYEPCGLVQMECQRYGALPIVRHTGGLADTIAEHPVEGIPSPNGFHFPSMEPHAFLGAIRRAIHIYQNPDLLRTFRRNTLLQDNGWKHRIDKYEALYKTFSDTR